MNPILERLDAERRTLARLGESLDVLPHVTRVTRTDRCGHGISYSRLTEVSADQVIAEQVEHYRTLGVDMEWKLYGHDQPGDLLQRLARHGFAIGPQEAVMVLDLDCRPEWVIHPPAYRVIRVASPSEVDRYRSTAEAIFQKDYRLTEGDLRRALKEGSTEHLAYLGMEGDTAVSIGRLYTHSDSVFGGLYGGATLPMYRSRGWYRAVIAARARDAVELGARYLIVDALPSSRPILARLGFQRVDDSWPCELHFGGR